MTPVNYKLAYDTKFKGWTMFVDEPLKVMCVVCKSVVKTTNTFFLCAELEEFFCSNDCEFKADRIIHSGHEHNKITSLEVNSDV